ncbi:MAG: LytTR family transcriptional regulator, partial [Flavobacteriales bacterium]|nr:LytTR family transcriptional regulator [Flavobacteriales bacterium]
AMGFFHLSAITFLVFIGFTLVVGAFPVTVGVLLRQNAYQRQYLAQSELYNTQIDSQHADLQEVSVDKNPVPASTKTAYVKLQEEGSGKPFECPAVALLAIEAADNYVKLHLDPESADAAGNPFRKTELLRLPLSAAEEALSARPAFFRCHRSWLVNLDRLENVEGNARGYRLHLEGMKGSVPVSRSRIPDFQAAMEVLG